MELKTFDKQKNKIVSAGYFNFKNKWYLKNSSDYCVKHNGYGISTDIYHKLILLKCEYVIIPTKKAILVTRFVDWINNGFYDDIGSGLQIFIQVKLVKVLKL